MTYSNIYSQTVKQYIILLLIKHNFKLISNHLGQYSYIPIRDSQSNNNRCSKSKRCMTCAHLSTTTITCTQNMVHNSSQSNNSFSVHFSRRRAQVKSKKRLTTCVSGTCFCVICFTGIFLINIIPAVIIKYCPLKIND